MVAAAPSIHCLRDPTRGGLAATLNELAQQSRVGMRLVESAIPFKPDVARRLRTARPRPALHRQRRQAHRDLREEDAPAVLEAMRAHPLGRDAAIIGEVVADLMLFVQMKTKFGGSRMVDWLSGDPLPRIC